MVDLRERVNRKNYTEKRIFFGRNTQDEQAF